MPGELSLEMSVEAEDEVAALCQLGFDSVEPLSPLRGGSEREKLTDLGCTRQ